jgi:hypothetical protein
MVGQSLGGYESLRFTDLHRLSVVGNERKGSTSLRGESQCVIDILQSQLRGEGHGMLVIGFSHPLRNPYDLRLATWP